MTEQAAQAEQAAGTAHAGPAHREELVYTAAQDGVPLEGVVIRPARGTTHAVAVVWVHGLASRFYSLTGVRIGRTLAAHGHLFVAGNNRGHDFGAIIRRTGESEPSLGGGAWELLSESPLDVAAWVEYAAALPGVRGVLLVGHSLGAIKVGRYAATGYDPRVLGVVAASAPGSTRTADPALLEHAQRLVAEGRGRDLLPWDSTAVGGGTMSAATYLDRWRNGGAGFDVYGLYPSTASAQPASAPSPARPAPLISHIRVPLFALYGSDEAWVGGAAELETIKRNATAAPRVETRFVEGADHGYLNHEAEVAAQLAAWAASL